MHCRLSSTEMPKWSCFPLIHTNSRRPLKLQKSGPLSAAIIPVKYAIDMLTAVQATLAFFSTNTARSCLLRSGRQHIGQAFWILWPMSTRHSLQP